MKLKKSVLAGIDKTNKGYYKQIGKKIRYFRKIRGLKQQELADALGVTWETISRWENGNVSPLRRLNDIANALEIPLAYLISDVIPEELAQQQTTPKGIPYVGRLPKTYEDFITTTRRTLFNLDLSQLANTYHVAVQVEPDAIQNETSIPVDHNTILIVKPVDPEGVDSRYGLYYSEQLNKFILALRKQPPKDARLVAAVSLIMLQ